jgi:hypothetical protein
MGKVTRIWLEIKISKKTVDALNSKQNSKIKIL